MRETVKIPGDRCTDSSRIVACPWCGDGYDAKECFKVRSDGSSCGRKRHPKCPYGTNTITVTMSDEETEDSTTGGTHGNQS